MGNKKETPTAKIRYNCQLMNKNITCFAPTIEAYLQQSIKPLLFGCVIFIEKPSVLVCGYGISGKMSEVLK